MGYKRFSVCVLLALAGCTSAQDTTKQGLDTVGNETSASWNKMRDYFDVGNPKKDRKENAAPRYCYKAYEDVICYSHPMPGQEERLTGYQEASGKTGYVLPAHRHAPPDNFTLPPLKPVTVNTPPPVAGADAAPKKQLKEVIFDPAELEPKQLVPDKEQ